MTREEATQTARREFGNITLTEERGREIWQWPTIENFFGDIRYSLRLMRKSPTFTAVAVSILALGIGANTAIFSLLNGLVLRDLAVPHPEQLVRVGAHDPGDPFTALSLPMFEEISRDRTVFSGMFAWGGVVLNVEADRVLSRADIWAVTGNFHSELGAVPELGRLLTPEDVNLSSASPDKVAVLSYGFWQRHYRGSRDVIGKTIKIETLPFTIIGVTREGFTAFSAEEGPAVTVPVTAEPSLVGDSDIQKHLNRRDALWLDGAARLKPGVTLEQARVQLESLWPAIRQTMRPVNGTAAEAGRVLKLQLKVESGAKGGSFLRERFTKPLYILMAIAGVVLLAACVNLASLMLARASSRAHEMGVRIALRASRARLVRQMLTESVTLSIAGTVIGFILAYWGSRALADFILGQIYIVPAALNLSPDWRVLGFTAAAALLTGVLFGLAPAWRATREDPNAALQQSTRTVTKRHGLLSNGLIVAQVALSVILLAGAGLFLRSLQNLHDVEPGFRTHGLLQVELVPKPGGYKNMNWVSYYRQLTERISNLPGVISAALVHSTPGNIIEWDRRSSHQRKEH